MKKKTIKDLDDAQVRGKRALVRVDFNVPLDENGQITDDTRIRASLPTIELLLERQARTIIISHLGRPKGKPDPKYSLQPVSKRLEELCGSRVTFVESTDSDEALQASQNLKSGEILLLENTRFLGGEEKNDPRLSRALAELGDFFVNGNTWCQPRRFWRGCQLWLRFLKPVGRPGETDQLAITGSRERAAALG